MNDKRDAQDGDEPLDLELMQELTQRAANKSLPEDPLQTFQGPMSYDQIYEQLILLQQKTIAELKTKELHDQEKPILGQG